MAPTKHLLGDALELAALLTPAWGAISAGIPAWHPRCEDPPADPKDPPPADPPADPADPPAEPNWKAESRKHEARAKQERKAREDLEAKLREREQADQTEQEKAIAAARDEGKAEALTQAQEERRSDRLEVAVTRLAAKTFADTDDALLNVQRAIKAGDIDPDDIFTTEGQVQTAALTTALDELLERKPHLKVAPGQLAGDGDGGKGAGAKDPEALGVEGHLAEIQGRK